MRKGYVRMALRKSLRKAVPIAACFGAVLTVIAFHVLLNMLLVFP